ncbi:hypothetical protein WJX84_012041 [Apatococcus fuscideae]|uniref:SET domain-containing protein n=1 Tax=Apatococcus fuscideae TaxID=2026836 RepID=A0AAW1S8Q5_9CHLO
MHVQQLNAWLEDHRADLSGVQIQGNIGTHRLVAGEKPSKSAKCSFRARVFDLIRRRPAEICLARFPLSEAFTARNIIQHSNAGPGYHRASEGLVDERELVMFALMTERLKGPKSPWCSWIATLPETFDTPTYYSDAELAELQGTNLHHAARLLKKQMAAVWQRLGPICARLLREEGIKCRPPCLDDLLWSYSTFWSRGQAIPMSLKFGAEVEEGLVPGLDMCNHASPAPARWNLDAGQSPAGNSSDIYLMVERSTACQPGAEVSIDYGDKSNEELLLLYGFCTHTRNVNDQLMIPLLDTAIPPDDPMTQARMMLLERHDCKAQLFLPFALLHSSESRHLAGAHGIPEAAFKSLQIWATSPQQLARELSKEPPGKLDEADAPLTADILDLLVHLLSSTVERLEGPAGTGSLDADIRLLNSQAELPVRLQHSIIYRAGQKKLARAFLQQFQQAAKAALQQASPDKASKAATDR